MSQYEPSIFIGLGGTGAKSLHHLRQHNLERYGHTTLPATAFLSIDTDMTSARSFAAYGSSNDAVAFREDERVTLKADLQPILEVLRHGKAKPYLSSWWDPAAFVSDDFDLSCGSGQIRALARLACFENQQRICQAIHQAYQQVTAMHIDSPRVIQNGRVNVYIIAGLAGGTGSGTFLDVAAMVKAALGNDVPTTGYFVLPDVYRQLDSVFDKMAANGVAALRELNHYMNNPFVVNWGTQEHTIERLYDHACMLTGTNSQDLAIAQVNDVYRMIGEALSLRFSGGELANLMESVRINRQPYLQQTIRHSYEAYPANSPSVQVTTESWRTCFSGFGVSKLSYPTWRLFHYARYDLAKQLIDHMSLLPTGAPVIWAQRFQQDLGIFQGRFLDPEADTIAANRVVRMLEKALAHLPGSSEDILNSIQVLCNKLVVDANSMLDDGQGATTRACNNVFNRLKTKLGDPDTPRDSGEWARMIEASQKFFEKSFKPKLNEIMYVYCQKYGLFALNKIIDETIKAIEMPHDQSYYIDHLRMNAEKFETESRDVYDDWQRLVNQAEEAAKPSLLNAFLSANRDIHKAAVDSASQKLMRYWVLKFRAYISKCAVSCLQYSLGELKRAQTRINHIIHGLEEFSHQFRQLRDSYRQSKDNPLFQELEVEHDYDELLHPYLGYTAEDQERRLTILSQKVMGRGGLNLTSVDALEHAILKEPKQFRDQLSAALFQALKGGPNGKTTAFMDNPDLDDEAIEGFLQRHSITNRLAQDQNLTNQLQAKLGQLLQNGLPWVKDGRKHLPRDLHAYDEILDIVVGVPNRAPQVLTDQITTALNQIAQANNLNTQVVVTSCGDPSAIVIATEMHAFPVFHFSCLYGHRGLNASYEKLLYGANQRTALHLHRDFHTFDRLIPMNANERQTYTQALQFFLEGQIIGIFQTENAKLAPQTSNQYHFVQRQEQNGTIRYETLGSEDEVVHYLSHQSQQKTKLLLAAQRQHLRNLGVTFADLCAITRYWMHCLYPLREIQNGEIVGSIEFSVLEKLEAEYKNLSTENNELSDEVEFENHIYDRLVNLQSWTVPIARSKGSKFPWRATISPESRFIPWGKEEGLVESLTAKLDSYIQEGWIDPTLLRSAQKVFPRLAINPRFWQVEQKDQAPPPSTTQPTPPNPSFWYSPDHKHIMLCRASEIANRFQQDVKPMICVDQNWSAAVQSVAEIKAWLDYENQAEPPPHPPPLP